MTAILTRGQLTFKVRSTFRLNRFEAGKTYGSHTGPLLHNALRLYAHVGSQWGEPELSEMQVKAYGMKASA